jgi:hypothetical protein
MPAGFRHYPLSSDSSATGQISARQVDAACRVRLTDFLRRPPRGETLRGQIDALVYDLYALTPAEIKIVEGVTA